MWGVGGVPTKEFSGCFGESVVFSPHFPPPLLFNPFSCPSPLSFCGVCTGVHRWRPQEGHPVSSSNGFPPSPLRKLSLNLEMVVL